MSASSLPEFRTSARRPRPSEVVRQQLGAFEAVKREADSYGTPDAASMAGWRSILAHEQDLLDELHAAQLLESSADAEFHIVGPSSWRSAVPVILIGRFLDRLQQLVNAIASVSGGKDRGRWTEATVKANRVMLEPEFMPGSFGFRVRLPKTPEEIGELFPPEPSEALDLAARALCPGPLGEDLTELLSFARVKNHYREAVRLFSTHDAGLSARTRSNPFAQDLSAREASARVDWLDTLSTRHEDEWYTGRLVGGHIEPSLKFELRTSDGSLLRGDVAGAAEESMKLLHLGDTVRMRLRLEISEHDDLGSLESPSYTALSIDPVEGEAV